MISKKAQGLPLSFIVIAAISALVLILIVTFTIGGFGSFGKQIIGSSASDLESTRDICRANCAKLAAITSDSQWVQSAYCEKTFAVDLDGDGKAGGGKCAAATAALVATDLRCGKKDNTKFEVGLRCWDNFIGVSCTQSITTASGSNLFCQSPTSNKDTIGGVNNVCNIDSALIGGRVDCK